MLDGGCFIRAGLIHQLKLYPYSVPEGDRFVWGRYKVYFCIYNRFISIHSESLGFLYCHG